MRCQRKDHVSRRKKGGRRRKPPPFSWITGNSFDSVPKWERKFCSQMSWRDLCDKKRWIHLHPNVLNWDDSAGKEAFDDAKACYWAKINGLPCEIPSPDPDMYIDEIDHDAPIDPWLIEDLYSIPPPPPPPPCEEIWDLDSMTPTGWDVDPSPPNKIPEFIFATPHDINDNSALKFQTGLILDQKMIIPTGWGRDEKGTESNHGGYLEERQSNGAWNSERGTWEDQHRCKQREKGSDGIIYQQMGGGEGSFGLKYMGQKRIMA